MTKLKFLLLDMREFDIFIFGAELISWRSKLEMKNHEYKDIVNVWNPNSWNLNFCEFGYQTHFEKSAWKPNFGFGFQTMSKIELNSYWASEIHTISDFRHSQYSKHLKSGYPKTGKRWNRDTLVSRFKTDFFLKSKQKLGTKSYVVLAIKYFFSCI